MTRLTVSPREAAALIGRIYAQASKVALLTGRQVLYRTLLRVRNRMGRSGTRPHYPIRWDSERQRKAFFASDGFGGGIPSRRTDRYRKSWKVIRIKEGYQLTNTAPHSKYVGGNAYGVDQSRIHRGRWQLLRDVTDEELAKMPEELVRNIMMVARRAARETR